ncbi:MAG: site-specific DNA-methyltransferase [Dehalococcoidia bacterium]|nr:site-specific DNA-methyltransferase [Dehalococcoidia bacterium]
MPSISDTFSPEQRIVLHEGDSHDFLKGIPKNTATLIITSPPYNIGKEYETRTSIESYLKQQEPVIGELVRILKDEGSLCWQVGNFVEDSEVFPLDIFYYAIFKKNGLKLRNRIIWHFGHGLHASKRFSGRYETILWFAKSDEYIFNLDSVRVPAKYPGKRHFKGPNIGKPSGNPLGKNPSDIWKFVAEEWERELWDIPNVKANHPEKTIHPCQFPIELVERCVLALTNEDDWVLDPYCGVGSALIAGLKHNRRVIGCDKESEYIKIAKERITDFFNGTLRIRPLGKPVYVATGKEKVSQVPDEWKVKKEVE